MTTSPRVALAGDWHGNTSCAVQSIRRLAVGHKVDTVLHVGDFGIWPGNTGAKYLRRVERACVEHGVRLLVTPGNHEAWPLISAHPCEERDDLGAVKWFTDHIAVLPRGHRFVLGGRTFVSLGGAPSIDFETRTRGADWWPEEMIERAEAAAVAAAGHADVMLTHDSPDGPWCTPRVAHICATNPLGWSRTALAYAVAGRRRLNVAYEGVRPRLLAHGHYHVADEVTVTSDGHSGRIVALAAGGQERNLALLDLANLDVIWIDTITSL